MRVRWVCRLLGWGVCLAVLCSLPAAASAAKSGWSIQSSPSPTADSRLGGVSCASRSVCIAVGGSFTPRFEPRRAMAERWNGRAWTVHSTPSPTGGALTAVSCVSSRACVAVGSVSPGPSVSSTFTERWNGRRWKIQPTPQDGILDSVSCTSARDCIAVGSYSGGGQTLAEQWNGKMWKVQPTPNPRTGGGYKSPPESYLDAVSCSSASACIAVGAYTPAYATSDPLVERWNGRRWTIKATPDATGRGPLNAVSCASASACTAVGMQHNHTEEDGAERWNGSKWTIQNTPNTYNGNLRSVSCPSKSKCTAVGINSTSNTTGYKTLVEHWNR
jgi:hypothetical protein